MWVQCQPVSRNARDNTTTETTRVVRLRFTSATQPSGQLPARTFFHEASTGLYEDIGFRKVLAWPGDDNVVRVVVDDVKTLQNPSTDTPTLLRACEDASRLTRSPRDNASQMGS
jgi:hypothetical protein